MYEIFEFFFDLISITLDALWGLLRDAWDTVKQTSKRVFRFSTDVVKWFKQPGRVRRMKKRGTLAAVIKEELDNGNFNMISCLVNPEGEEVYEARAVEVEELDDKTLEHFEDEDVLVLSYEG